MIRIRKGNDERYVSLGAFEEMYEDMGFYIVDENKKKPKAKEAKFEDVKEEKVEEPVVEIEEPVKEEIKEDKKEEDGVFFKKSSSKKGSK